MFQVLAGRRLTDAVHGGAAADTAGVRDVPKDFELRDRHNNVELLL
jgi:hypothetical protein